MDPYLNDFEKEAIKGARQSAELRPYQAELLRLQDHLEKEQKRMMIFFEGRDAAGKGGVIRRITRFMNERHYRVVALGKPTQQERSQWYFQRYVTRFPRGGEAVLFDRSWYNRALVERVFNFCTEEDYQNFMRGVVQVEEDLVRQGTIFIKIYLSVTKVEQATRFDRRKADPLRQWKLSEIDIQMQDRWDDFTEVKYQMLKRTHTDMAPWIIIRSHNKHLARLNAMKVLLNAVPYQRYNRQLDIRPDPNIVVSGADEIHRMEAEMAESGTMSY
jgi:polyphosphate kinase 2